MSELLENDIAILIRDMASEFYRKRENAERYVDERYHLGKASTTSDLKRRENKIEQTKQRLRQAVLINYYSNVLAAHLIAAHEADTDKLWIPDRL